MTVPARLPSPVVREIGRGQKVFDSAPVSGRLLHVDSPEDVLALMDTEASGVVALVRDAGATFLAPVYHELTAIVCTSGTPRSHIGIVSREFQLPCVMATVFGGQEPLDETEVEVDCSGSEGIIRA
jgi:signal transduction protein with GAF and PtsI domain